MVEERAAEKLQALKERYKLNWAAIARELGIPENTLRYYAGSYKKQHLPPDEAWAQKFREALMARRVPPEDAYDLYGLHYAAKAADQEARLHRIEELLEDIRRLLTERSPRSG